MHVSSIQSSWQIFLYIDFHFYFIINSICLYLCSSLAQKYIYRNMYILTPIETTKFHAIWGLCWHNFLFLGGGRVQSKTWELWKRSDSFLRMCAWQVGWYPEMAACLDRRPETREDPKPQTPDSRLLLWGLSQVTKVWDQVFGIKEPLHQILFPSYASDSWGGVGGGCLVLPVLVLQSCWSVCSLGPAVCSSYAICGTKFKIGWETWDQQLCRLFSFFLFGQGQAVNDSNLGRRLLLNTMAWNRKQAEGGVSTYMTLALASEDCRNGYCRFVAANTWVAAPKAVFPNSLPVADCGAMI